MDNYWGLLRCSYSYGDRDKIVIHIYVGARNGKRKGVKDLDMSKRKEGEASFLESILFHIFSSVWTDEKSII